MTRHHTNVKLVLAVVALTLIFTQTYAVGGNSFCRVDLVNGKLSLNIENQSLSSILSTIAEKTGITFEVPSAYADSVISLSFQALPIEMALDKILSQYSFIKLFGQSGDIHNVIIISSRSITGKPNGEQAPSAVPSTNSIKKDSEVARDKISGFSNGIRGISAGSERIESLSNPDSMIVGPQNNGKTAIVSESTADESLETPGLSNGIAFSSPSKGGFGVSPTSGSYLEVQPRKSSLPITQTGKTLSAKPANNEDMKISPSDGPMVIERPSGEEMKISDSLNKMKIEP